MQVSHIFRSLSNRNFSLFFCGQFISRIGMWMQRTAIIWLVYSMTHSALMIGVTTFAEQFPSFLFSIRGGIIADRYNRYKVILLTQSLSALQAVLLTILSFSGNEQVYPILALSVFLGIVNAYDVPVRQSMINDIVTDKDDLPNAIALNSSLNTFARLIGPALSGFVLAKWSAANCFLLNAVSFIAVIGAILAMRFPKHTFTVGHSVEKRGFRDAINYLRKDRASSQVLILAALSNLMVLPFVTLLPVYAKEIFHGDAALYGWLNAMIGVGAIIGAIHLASFKNAAAFKKLLLFNTFLLGLGLLLFSFVSNQYPAFSLLIVLGYSSISQSSICFTIIQMQTESTYRGRIISIMAMAVFGMLPLGSLLVGYISQHIGVSYTILSEAATGLLVAVVFYVSAQKENQA
ncbi:MAG: MFS transporter [Chryseobacterium sp.]|nr:MAG: MFS transporter [Chryseobacterium sp.]